MKTIKNNLIYILHHFDEMRHPYNSALAPFCPRVKWFSNLQTLLAASEKEVPLILIVDLDCLGSGSIEEGLESLKIHFGGSDFIILSSDHTAHSALVCMRMGFIEFLLKPTSPAELAWSVQKLLGHQQVSLLPGGKQDAWRVATRISACVTPSIVRVSTLQYLIDSLGGKGAVWFQREPGSHPQHQTLSAIPSGPLPTFILTALTRLLKKRRPTNRKLIVQKDGQGRKLFLPCREPHQGILIWGLKQRPPHERLEAAEAIRQHGEVSLQNIRRFEDVKQETFIDDLTGLFNSRYLKFALSNAISRSEESAQSFSVLFIDVDHFKTINDTHGHLIGSDFLIAIARTIKNAVRNIDQVFRYGGDEFVVILLDTPLQGAKDIGERIRKNIEKRIFHIRHQEVRTTVSIGIATYPEHTKERDTLLQLADAAMYHAKKHTRNAVFLAYGLPKQGRPQEPEKDA